MTLQIIEKGQTFDLNIASKRTNPTSFYFGAGWDTKDGAAVDLDIVVVAVREGSLKSANDYVYFGNRTSADIVKGIYLSADNTTGEGEGDDEDVVINTAELPEDVDSVIVGLVAYAGADLSCAPNTHFRVCDGDNEESEQIGDVALGDAAVVGDTAIKAFKLTRTPEGFVLENLAEFQQLGAGTGAIQKFGAQFQA